MTSKMTGALFERFVAEHLMPSLERGDIVVWLGAKIHTPRAVELVEAARACVEALPCYSLELNAIELSLVETEA